MSQGIVEVKESIKQISAKRREWDEHFSDLQGLLKGKTGKQSVSKVRQEFQLRVQKLREGVRTSLEQLDVIKYRVQKLRQEGNDVQSSFRSVEALFEFFRELERKVKEQRAKGETEISERQKWEIAQHQNEGFEEESQLIMAAGTAREVREQAETVLSSLQSQGGRLQAAKDKMNSVLKNINLSGNIANLIKRRSKEDNRLILLLSLGLIVQIYLCVYYIRPFFKDH